MIEAYVVALFHRKGTHRYNSWRVECKLLVLLFSALHGLAQGYMFDLLTQYAPTRNRRSASAGRAALESGELRQTCFLGARTDILESFAGYK